MYHGTNSRSHREASIKLYAIEAVLHGRPISQSLANREKDDIAMVRQLLCRIIGIGVVVKESHIPWNLSHDDNSGAGNCAIYDVIQLITKEKSLDEAVGECGWDMERVGWVRTHILRVLGMDAEKIPEPKGADFSAQGSPTSLRLVS